MKLYLRGHDFRYAAEQTMMTLFPGQRPSYPDGEPDGSGPAALLALSEEGGTLAASATLWWAGGVFTGERQEAGPGDNKARQRLIRLAFYDAGVSALGHEPPWGSLTGVRPVKLPTRWMWEGASPAEAERRLTELYQVSSGRAALAMECAQAALTVKRRLEPGTAALYVGIPFCPTRCAYCSFISADVKGALALVEPYVDALCREIAAAGRELVGRGLSVSSFYMGGGTPTTLSAAQLDRVLSALERELPMAACREWTVEAGRPDTIDGDKLAVLRAHGVGRISVNPQTMENSVLRAMGRAHTAEQIRQAMALAERHFGGLVNMDLIAGLPTDTVEGFGRTVAEVLAMGPANITVHTLALKKGARLMEQPERLCTDGAVADMLALAEEALRGAGYRPYYLYRQKYVTGSFENVGWCLPGTECEYNIVMMEELQSVLSLGAGGVTKLIDPATGYIERLGNPKYPKEYLDSGERIAADKAKAAAWIAEHR